MRPSPSALQGAAPRQREVVVVDDDDLLRHALKRLLSSDGRTSCLAAPSVEEAQQLLDTHDPAMVVTDLNLGGRLDGIDLLLWMRRTYRLRDVPVLLMTAEDPDEVRIRLDGAGLSHVDLLRKPFERDALSALLARLAR